MKNVLQLFLLFLLVSCTQNDDILLNDEVYNGKGGISCEVNGEVLKPSTAILYNNKSFSFGTDANNVSLLSISFTNSKGYDFKSIQVVGFNADYESNLVGKVFNLQSETNKESFGNYNFIKDGVENKFTTTEIKKGELKILFFDKQKNIMGGTFWFDAINSNGEMVKVRNGKFDLIN